MNSGNDTTGNPVGATGQPDDKASPLNSTTTTKEHCLKLAEVYSQARDAVGEVITLEHSSPVLDWLVHLHGYLNDRVLMNFAKGLSVDSDAG
jgi:hypothetical protein